MASTIKHEMMRANATYAGSFGAKSELAARPARQFLILTCIDARLDPAKFAGFAEGDAHVFRNAGGRATDDAIRSLVVSHKLLGTREWFVIHHTDCGMSSIDDQTMVRLLNTSLTTAIYNGSTWVNQQQEGGSPDGHAIEWMSVSDPQAALIDDVRRIRTHPLVSPEVVVYGFMYDVKTGLLSEYEPASAVGVPPAARKASRP